MHETCSRASSTADARLMVVHRGSNLFVRAPNLLDRCYAMKTCGRGMETKEDDNARYGTCSRQHAGGLRGRHSGVRCKERLERRQSRSAVLSRRGAWLRRRRLLLSRSEEKALSDRPSRPTYAPRFGGAFFYGAFGLSVLV